MGYYVRGRLVAVDGMPGDGRGLLMRISDLTYHPVRL
jgi:hypothetical protein